MPSGARSWLEAQEDTWQFDSPACTSADTDRAEAASECIARIPSIDMSGPKAPTTGAVPPYQALTKQYHRHADAAATSFA